MSNVIMSTDYCYEGKSEHYNVWELGSYGDLYSREDIDKSTIEYSNIAWEDEKAYFGEFIQKEIDIKEGDTGSNVELIGLIGSVGLWDGSRSGGKLLEIEDINKILDMDVDKVSVSVGDNREITVYGSHHDGTHSMGIYLVTADELKEVGILDEFYEYGLEEVNTVETFKKLADNVEPLKLSSNNMFFGV